MPVIIHPIPSRLDRWQKLSLPVGCVGLIIGAAGLILSPRLFFNGWLYAWWFWLGVSLGGLGITMLHHMTGGNWGLAVRRQCEAAAAVMPLMFLFMLPMMAGIYYLFPWGNHSWWSADPVLVHQHVYFNTPWFFVRNCIYFGFWCWLSWKLINEATWFQQTGDFALARRMRNLSAGGIVLFFVTVTAASYDWLMSRETYFYSTDLGFMICVGMTMVALSMATAMVPLFQEAPRLGPILEEQTKVDIGNLLLTHVILWAYVSFAQLLIVWMGNIKIEAGWYVHRGIGENFNGWAWVGLFLFFFGFLVPFLLLLQRQYIKKHLIILAGVALGMFIVHAMDVMWLSLPSSPPYTYTGRTVWMAIPLWFGIGGFWFWGFVYMLRRRPVIPLVEDTPIEIANSPTMGSQTGDQEL